MIAFANSDVETMNSVEPATSSIHRSQPAIDSRRSIIRDKDLYRKEETESSLTKTDNISDSETPKLLLAPPLVRLPPGSLPTDRVLVLQRWEGVVTEVIDDSFFADIQDLGSPNLPLEVVELPLDEISVDDRPLLVEGAIFYWSIGHETSPGGQLRRMSEIRMQRMPKWTKRTVKQVKWRAEELFELHAK